MEPTDTIIVVSKAVTRNNGRESAVSAYACYLAFVGGGKSLKTRMISGFCQPVNLTNMAAEIYAANRGLIQIRPNFRNSNIILFSSCKYLVGVINEGWDDSKNKTLFDELRKTINLFDTPPSICFAKKSEHCFMRCEDTAFRLISGVEND